MALVNANEGRELAAWKKFEVVEPVKAGTPFGAIVDTRWVLTWKMVGGEKAPKGRLVAKGYQGPILKDGFAETSGFAGLRPGHHQPISMVGWLQTRCTPPRTSTLGSKWASLSGSDDAPAGFR